MNAVQSDLSQDVQAADQSRTTSRVAWVDVAKGIGIVLVVYGNVSGGLVDAGIQQRGSTANAASALIYTFHMPLFFFLSGIWLARTSAKPFSQFARQRIGTIVYPYVLWSAIQFIANRAMARFTNAAPEAFGLLSIVYQPYAQFWFLCVLFIDLILVTLLLKLKWGSIIAVALGAVAYAAYPLAEALPWHPAAQLLRFFIYVAAGAAVGPWLVRSGMGLMTRIQGSLVASVCLALLVAGFWRSPQVNSSGLAAASILGTISVVAASCAITGTLPAQILEFLGKRSLEIYVAHVLGAAGMRIILVALGGVYNPLTHFLLGVGAGILFPITLWWIASRLRLGFLFSLRPDTVSTRARVHNVPGDAMPA